VKWYELLKSHKEHTAGEDIADSIALAIICALLLAVVCFL
jgi:hypothetical protein